MSLSTILSPFCPLFSNRRLADFSLVGHVVNTSTVANKFECHQKCLGNSNCKSFNVHPTADITKRVCELNKKTREMKQRGFIKRKGSSYHGHIQVSTSFLKIKPTWPFLNCLRKPS